ncbi:PREDICTED: polynucleotide 3'-phosphatase ZDP isoform X4 [Ipomoea nil]|uniref:polynucleotide 3'-phosphatase ZDP isoform X4 n=1 Tax=Ipomoea nil TaxID=35883 RepID=UPI000901E213|nr:PREDICTED: polynucleotide 3'-phosphatase ZDP isoform X4 [Ipomoea nil]
MLRTLTISSCSPISLNPSVLPLLLSFSSSSMATPAKVVAEYAKSSKSSCKKCSKAIAASSLRLGLVSKAPQGFNMTKWHHMECFPLSSDPIPSASAISGFSSLKSSDQEDLTKFISEATVDKQEVSDKDESAKKESRKRMITETSASIKGPEVEISFSIIDVKSHYKDAKLLPKWKAFQTTIYLEQDEGLLDSEKIAAFDFDGCLAKTSVKRIGANAWSLMYPSVPEKLQCLYNDGYKLVIFTNESNIERWKNKRQTAVDSKIGRLEDFIKRVKVPIQVFIACGSSTDPADPFRKPKIGMWNLLKNHFNSELPVDMDKSFYVGDAAGRKNDHSDADIKFAEAIGLKFYLPEDFFST